MAVLTQGPRGTQDVAPKDTGKWQYVERTALEVAEMLGFNEIRIPTFEHTELFNRSVGDTTDVVQKEMYTFEDKGGRSITLRPEGTAGVTRSVIEHGLLGDALPLKTSYVISCFRYEKPQAGRLREFHQFGVEAYGSAEPSMDVEVIAVMSELIETLGLRNITLEINSIGCPTCRANYHKALREHFAAHKEELCETCLGRLDKNPMRILDCKSPVCSALAEKAPRVLDYICEDCATHFAGVKSRLDAVGIAYVVNPTIVRGLDYYNRTVFEFISSEIGAQGTICGGGRYDGLVKSLGGPDLPGIGFASGIERLIMLMEKQGCVFPQRQECSMYIGSIGEAASIRAAALVHKLRQEGFYAECDTMGRSVKAQMKYADKLGAKLSCVLGDDELAQGRAKIKDMRTGEIAEVELDALSDYVCDKQVTAYTAEAEQGE